MMDSTARGLSSGAIEVSVTDGVIESAFKLTEREAAVMVMHTLFALAGVNTYWTDLYEGARARVRAEHANSGRSHEI